MAEFRLSAFADEAAPELDKQIEALRRHRISMLEIRGVDGKNMSELTDDEARDVKRRLDDGGISLSALGSPYGKYPIDAPFEAHARDFRRGLELAHLLGAKAIRMFSFFMPEGCKDPGVWKGAVIDRLGRMLEWAADAGVALCHENEKAIFGDTGVRCRELLDAFEGMGFVFDPANFVQCGVKPLEAYELLEDRVTYMHVKDALFADGAVVPAGLGEGDVAEILRRLNRREGPVTLTIEPHLAVFPGSESLQRDPLDPHRAYPDSASAFDAAVHAARELLAGLN